MMPKDYRAAAYRESIIGHTNDRGEFRFDNLEPIEYQAGVSGVVHPDVQIIALPDGRQQFVFPNEHRLFLRAGDPAAARIAVQLLPDSPLKTVAPPWAQANLRTKRIVPRDSAWFLRSSGHGERSGATTL